MFALISSPSQYYNLLEFIAQGIVKADDITMIYFNRKNEFKKTINILNATRIVPVYK